MIVNSGKDDIALNYIRANYQRIKVGNGGDDTTAGSLELDMVVATTNNIEPSVAKSSLTWTVSFTGTQLSSQGVSELGIFKSDDTLLSRVTFTNTGIVAASDIVTFVISLEVN